MEYESARIIKGGSINKNAPDDQITMFLHNMIGQVVDAANERGLQFNFIDVNFSVTDKRWIENVFQSEVET